KHQLRRHMKHISHHILGDTKHGRGELNKLIRQEFGCNRMLLHANELQIKHPRTDEMLIIQASLDETFKAVFNAFNWDDKIV
ncbi:MAG: tRNA pseudouridine65 synthase, partial [Campylobacterota bacterium]|nr:tRNA pseudouridine65 synthase [Campylobacterota bacterium]